MAWGGASEGASAHPPGPPPRTTPESSPAAPRPDPGPPPGRLERRWGAPHHTLCDLGLVAWLLQVSVCEGVLTVIFISRLNCLQRRLPNAHLSGTHIRKKGLLPGYKEAQRPTAHPRSHSFMFPTVLKRKALIRAPSELFVTPQKNLYLRLVGWGSSQGPEGAVQNREGVLLFQQVPAVR